LSRADVLILEAATGARRLSRAELREVLEHVARAGFDPDARERAGGRLEGLSWRGQVLRGNDYLPPAEAHYLRHVVGRPAWAPETTLGAYLERLRPAVGDEGDGGGGGQQLGTGGGQAGVRRSYELRGPEGYEWVAIEYRVTTGHWMTAFQPEEGLAYFQRAERREQRWLRRPR